VKASVGFVCRENMRFVSSFLPFVYSLHPLRHGTGKLPLHSGFDSATTVSKPFFRPFAVAVPVDKMQMSQFVMQRI
jgi:hypothetical protein